MNVEACFFEDDGATPNNPRLPLLLMRGTPAMKAVDPAAWLERKFISNGWTATWRWTVYPYHHYHTTSHEVLGVSRGTAILQLGGEGGRHFEVSTGDVIVIPAGVGHKRIDSTRDFQVVGAYPDGKEPDLIRSGEEDTASALRRISSMAA